MYGVLDFCRKLVNNPIWSWRFTVVTQSFDALVEGTFV